MPRIRQNTATYAREDLLRDIREKQGRHEMMNVRALSQASGIPYQILLRRLQNPDDLTIEELRKLNIAIGLDPLVLLSCFSFSKKDIRAYLGADRNEES